MSSSATWVVVATVADRGGNRSFLTYYCPVERSVAQVKASFESWLDPLMTLLDVAWLVVKVSKRFTFDDPGTPSGTSDIHRVGVLLYREGDICEAIYLPSVKEELIQSVGTFAGVGLDTSASAFDTFSAAAISGTPAICTAEGEAWPQVLTVGGVLK